jgi:hypothetical protein
MASLKKPRLQSGAENNASSPVEEGGMAPPSPNLGVPPVPPPGQSTPFPPPGGPVVAPPQGGAGRAGETPRDRQGSQAAPARPGTPTPMAGSTFQPEVPQGPGVIPFEPLPSTDIMGVSRRGLFGSRGGLQGGGIGLPLDPTSNQASDPISGLIQLLLRGGK